MESLSTLTTLKNLTINYCFVKSLSGVENLIDLEGVFVNEIGITNIDLLQNLNKLNTIQIQNCMVQDISALRNLNSLKKVIMNGNDISKGLYALKDKTLLEELNLSSNPIFDTDLDFDDVSFNVLEMISNLNYQQNGKLRKLFLGNTKIIDFKSVSNLTWDDWSGFNGK